METSLAELTGKLTDALKESQQADTQLESAMAKLDPLRLKAKEAHDQVNALMASYQQMTGATPAASPTRGYKKRGTVPGSTRGPRSTEAVVMTSISRVLKAALSEGKKK